ncbi:MAG: hypothetical protein FIA99_01780 [Ruminiclostridium sp.]|nr:hypothetical protein [Ruminiclostridium sp.]
MPVVLSYNGEEIFVDDIDYAIANQYKWYIRYKNERVDSVYTIVNGRSTGFSRIVLNLEKGKVAFHKNGNSLDYRRDNLLICDRHELGHVVNYTGGQSGYYGVVQVKSNSWAVRIVKGKNKSYIGTYNDPRDAAIVAEYIVLDRYGNIGGRNFPELSREEIEKLFIIVQEKYGYDIREKLSRLKQGIKRTNIKTSSRFVGVSWNKEKGKWEARIRYKGKKFHLGCFDVEEDAAKARDRKAVEIYGEHANLNFPEEFLK